MVPRRLRCTLLAMVFAFVAPIVAQGQDVESEALSIQHESTVPANRGERVRLAVEHYPPLREARGAVVTVSSDALPADVGLGLGPASYNHLAFLAAQGFHVFAADMTGYGASPRPRMRDACNTPHEMQNELLIPHPLYIPCEGGYERLLTSLETDWDELDSVLEHVRDVTGRERVHLMGWGLGAARVAGYASRYPAAVASLVLIAPAYAPDASGTIPSPYPDGFPLVVHDVDEILAAWGDMSSCESFADVEAVSRVLSAEILASDPLAADWGLVPGDLFRSPGHVGLAGWNRQAAAAIEVPTLLIRGLQDDRVDGAEALFRDIGSDEKVLLEVECGTHWLMWEATREAVSSAIAEFLATGAVGGRAEASLVLDRNGSVE